MIWWRQMRIMVPKESLGRRCMRFNQFINWHNPIVNNYDQVHLSAAHALRLYHALLPCIVKFSPCFGIQGRTCPLHWQYQLDCCYVKYTYLHSTFWGLAEPNTPADKLLAGGCGFMNHAALQRLVQHLGLESIPAGVHYTHFDLEWNHIKSKWCKFARQIQWW